MAGETRIKSSEELQQPGGPVLFSDPLGWDKKDINLGALLVRIVRKWGNPLELLSLLIVGVYVKP